MDIHLTNHIEKNRKQPDGWKGNSFKPELAKIRDYVIDILKLEVDIKERNKLQEEKLERHKEKVKIIKKFLLKFTDKSNIDKVSIDDYKELAKVKDRFRKVYELINLNHKTTPEKRTIHFTFTLFEIPEYIPPKEYSLPSLSLSEQHFINALKETYTTHSDFTLIPIMGDIEGKVPRLSMDNYYMDLAFLEREEIKTRDALIKKEQESFRKKVSQNNFPHNYISDAILTNENSIVVLGNPGTGKSTFARWLCHKWGKDNQAHQITPVYISLRDLNKGRKKTIEKYIKNTYLKKIKYNLTQFLSDNKQVKLILDGLDELSDKNKESLYKEIIALNLNNNYILFSRPYALFRNEFQNAPSLEIVGYNNVSRERFINLILSKAVNKQITQTELLKKLENNPILNDLSYNPLMLSFMILHCFDKEDRQDLEAVESTFQMHEWVLNKIIWYADDRKYIKAEEWPKNQLLIQSFAYQIITKKNFVYHGKSMDRHIKAAQILSKAGFGKLESKGSKGWKFNFHSITTLEYLAAQYVEDNITPDDLIEISQDSYFWNFVIMVTSYKSQLGKIDFILRTLNCAYESYTKNKNYYSWHLYFCIISETNKSTLNCLINEQNLNMLFCYSKHVHFSQKEKKLTFDSIKKIYSKLDKELKENFLEYYVSLKREYIFELTADKNKKYPFLSPAPFELYEIIPLAKNSCYHQKVVALVVECIAHIQLKYSGGFHSEIQFRTYQKAINTLLNLLTSVPWELAEPLIAKINDFNGSTFYKYPNTLNKPIIQTLTYTPHLIQSIEKLTSKIISIENISTEKMATISENLIQNIESLCLLNKRNHLTEKIRIKNLILLACNLITEFSHQNSSRKALRRIYSSYCDLDLKCFDTTIYFLEKIQEINLKNFTNSEIDLLIQKSIDKDYPDLFVIAFYKASLEKIISYQYLDKYLLLVQHEIKSKKRPLQHFRFISDIALYNHSNTILIHKIIKLELSNYEYFWGNYLFEKITYCEYCSAETWALIKKYIFISDTISRVVDVISNKNIYHYSSNIKHLIELWDILFDYLSKGEKKESFQARLLLLLLKGIKNFSFYDTYCTWLTNLRTLYPAITDNEDKVYDLLNFILLEFLLPSQCYQHNLSSKYNSLSNYDKQDFKNEILNVFSLDEIVKLNLEVAENFKAELIKAKKNEQQLNNKSADIAKITDKYKAKATYLLSE